MVAAIGIQIGDEFLSSLKEVERLAQERAKEARQLKEVEVQDVEEV